jgi:DNA-binding NarL/FixJ family response regulator
MTLEHGPTSRQQLTEKVSIEPSIVVLDPLMLRRSCIAHILKEWSKSEGLTINSVARVTPGSRPDLNQNCRLFVISVGGKSVADEDVRHNIQTAKLLFPDVPVLIVSDLDDQAEVFEAFRLGAKGFIPTSLDPKIALRACTFILGGGSYYPPSALAAARPAEPGSPADAPGQLLINHHDVPTAQPVEQQPIAQEQQIVPPAEIPGQQQPCQGDDEPSVAGRLAMILTERQGQVANLLKDGLPNKMIARHLGMTEATVKVHVRQIMRKLGVHNRTQVALSISSVSAGTPGEGTEQL